MRTVARIITRMTDEKDGLFLGVTLKGNSDLFEPNSVYELREIMGEISLVKVGEAHVNWGMRIDCIVDENPAAFLTKEEYERERRQNDG